MEYTIGEIRAIVRIARDHPDIHADDIASSVVEGYSQKNKLHAIIANVASLFIDKPPIARPTVKEILHQCCDVHDIRPEIVRMKTRKREIVRIRQQYYLMAALFRHTQQVAALEMYQDHATALHAKRNALNFYQTETEYRDEVNLIINRFPNHKTSLTERLTNSL